MGFQHGSHLLARSGNGLVAVLAQTVNSAGVAVFVREVGQHRLNDGASTAVVAA